MLNRNYGTGELQMRLAIGLVILWLLAYDDAALFKVLHGFLLNVLT